MSAIRVTPEQRLALATAADRPRTEAEALILARLADEQGMPGSAAAWREVAADGVATRAVPRHEKRTTMPATPPASGNTKSALQAVGITVVILLAGLMTLGFAVMPDPTPTPAPPGPVAAPAPAPAPGVAPVVPAAAPATPKTHAVTRVIDGDTFEIEGGQRVRLLGIDACEIATAGGKAAKRAAETFLAGESVVLVADGTRSQDRYGRMLARAEVDGVDVGRGLIPDPSVGVYEGRNDARPDYVAELRSRDDGPRDCSNDAIVPPPTEEPTEVYVEDDDDDRDRESRFCRKRLWC